MAGLIGAALTGALGGAGKGIATVGEINYKDQLDQHKLTAQEDMAVRAEERRLTNQRTLAAEDRVYQDAKGKASNDLQIVQADKLRAEIAKEKEIDTLRAKLANAESFAANDPAAKPLADAMRARLNVLTGAKPTETHSTRIEEDQDTGNVKKITEIKGAGMPPKSNAAAVDYSQYFK